MGCCCVFVLFGTNNEIISLCTGRLLKRNDCEERFVCIDPNLRVLNVVMEVVF